MKNIEGSEKYLKKFQMEFEKKISIEKENQ